MNSKEQYNRIIMAIEEKIKDPYLEAVEVAESVAQDNVMTSRDLSTIISFLTGSTAKQYITKRRTMAAYQYINYCIPMHGGAMTSTEQEYYQIFRVLVRRYDVDLDQILSRADAGTLLPEGARHLYNYYLSHYILTKDRALYTLHASDYYRKEYGFTLEDFASQCGDNPDFFFSPAVKGMPR